MAVWLDECSHFDVSVLLDHVKHSAQDFPSRVGLGNQLIRHLGWKVHPNKAYGHKTIFALCRAKQLHDAQARAVHLLEFLECTI
jgi:hypothetical protein